MGVKVYVRDNESIESALERFRSKESYEYKRWTKKRYGYYEKPSVLKRRRKKMAKLWQRPTHNCQAKLHFYIGLKELFARNGANNVAGH